MPKKNLPGILKFLQIASYLFFILLWFRHNFPELRSLTISPLIPLFVFLAITIYRIIPRLASVKQGIRRHPPKSFWILAGLIVLSLAFRLPFLSGDAVISDGDDGLIILQAKHIAEGEAPSIFNYGVNYESSTLMHLYAFLFKIFGYKQGILRLAALAIYCGFIVIQFILLKRIFGIEFAFPAGLFLALPLGHNIIASLNLSGDFPSILFLGSLIIYLTYKIRFEGHDRLLPVLGFLLGLTFWVHQMTISFILTSLIILALHFRVRLKKYLILAGYAVVGGFPVVISELLTGFSLCRFLLSGEKGALNFAAQLKRSSASLSYLMIRQDNHYIPVLLGLTMAGAVGLLLLGGRKKALRPALIYLVFPALFFLIYFLSSFSSRHILAVRYFYPLIFTLPVLLLGFLIFLPRRFRLAIGIVFLIAVLSMANWAGYREDISRIQESGGNLKPVLQALEETGHKFWQADFWDSFLITTLSGERIIASEHFSPGHYPPYLLDYCSQGRNNNLLFLNEPGLFRLAYREMTELISGNLQSKLHQSQIITSMLDMFEIPYQTKTIGSNRLIYDIGEDLPISIWRLNPPSSVPRIQVEKIMFDRSALKVTMRKAEGFDWNGFRLQTEIPAFSSSFFEIPNDKDSFEVRLPFSGDFPSEIHTYLNYFGIRIPSSRMVVSCPAPPQKRWLGKRVLIRSGLGPSTTYEKKRYRTCEKDMLIEVKPEVEKIKSLNIRLYSPFDFEQPYWYRPFTQSMTVKINGAVQRKITLKAGDNLVQLTEISSPEYAGQTVFVEVGFQYSFFFHFLPARRISSLLEDIRLE